MNTDIISHVISCSFDIIFLFYFHFISMFKFNFESQIFNVASDFYVIFFFILF